MSNNNLMVFIYGVMFFILISANFVMFGITNKSKKYMREPFIEEANEIIEYIKEIEENDKELAISSFDFMNLNMPSSIDEIKADSNNYQTIIDNFNMFFDDPDFSYLIFNDGSYMSSTNADQNYLYNHDLLKDDLYINGLDNFGFSVTQYRDFGPEKKIIYSYPLLNSYKKPIGVILKTRKVDYFLKKLGNIDASYMNFNVVVYDLNDNVIAYVDKNGIVKNDGTYDFEKDVKKLLDKDEEYIVTFQDEKYGLKYVFAPKDDVMIESFNRGISIVAICSLLGISVLVLICARKKFKPKRDVIICALIIIIADLSYFSLYKYYGIREGIEDIKVQAYLTNEKHKCDDKINGVIYTFVENSVLQSLDEETVVSDNDFSTIGDKLYSSIDKRMFDYLRFDKTLLVKNDKCLNIITNERTNVPYYMMGLYDEVIESGEKTLKKVIETENEKYVLDINKLSWGKESLLLISMRDGNALEDEAYGRNLLCNEVSEVYLAKIKNDKLYVSLAKYSSNYASKPYVDLKYQEIGKGKDCDKIKKFKNSDDQFVMDYFLDNDGRLVNMLFAKTYDTNQIVVFSINYSRITNIRNRCYNLIIGVGLVFLISVYANKKANDYFKNKKEIVSLHGNY